MKKTVSALLFTATLAIGGAFHAHADESKTMTVYKSPYCGCCKVWADALEDAGYTIKNVDMEDLSPIKKQAGISDDMMSCHTAVYGKYVLEGHVPLEAIAKLEKEQPEIHGLATPGMPMGSLGMGEPDANTNYTVFAIGGAGEKPVPYYTVGQ
ncbi:DUF411 domain-containing protein [Rhodobacteraceae bacterium RKSG542]|uniref:DUF411 domain-containing protein n=1 Tax=Pseudovibrio flavus TaxID=2529854 RepID=UPI0012BCC525|nr:DUF411 domain-containing protein [Pseudovibrio flavus]MTI15968.1 DUF411 domain-containing protein [Pseudovibrio flavus]